MWKRFLRSFHWRSPPDFAYLRWYEHQTDRMVRPTFSYYMAPSHWILGKRLSEKKKKLNGLIFKSRNAHEENQWKITSLTSSICFLRSIKFDVSLLLQLQVQSVWAQNFVFFRGAFASKRHVLPWHKMQSCHVAAEQRTDTYFSECSSGPSKPEVVGMPVRK